MGWLSLLMLLLKWGPTIFSIVKNLPEMFAMLRELLDWVRGLSRASRKIQMAKLEAIFADARDNGFAVSAESLASAIEPKLDAWRQECQQTLECERKERLAKRRQRR
jgi:hypothetical protein